MAQEGGVEVVPVAVDQENGSTKAVAAGFVSLKPQLVVPAHKAEEVKRVNYPKRKAEQELPFILCAELKIGHSSLLLCDKRDDAVDSKAAGQGVVFRLETEDVEAAVSKAVNAGAVLEGELAEEGPCGGGLVAKLKDQFGQVWIVASVGNKSTSDT